MALLPWPFMTSYDVPAICSQAVVAAHNNLAPAELSLAWGPLANASINRSPSAYLANPEPERTMYDANVEQRMDVLRIHEPGAGGR